MNNKGFAITTILYGTLILFLMLLLSMMGILNAYKGNLEKLVDAERGARDIIDPRYEVILDNQEATEEGTSKIYGINAIAIYLNSDYSDEMSEDTNGITVPSKNGYVFSGYYTEKNGNGKKLISEDGYITSEFTMDLYSRSITLYAFWS